MKMQLLLTQRCECRLVFDLSNQSGQTFWLKQPEYQAYIDMCEVASAVAVTGSIFVFAIGFGWFLNKSRGSWSVSVFMVVYKQYHTRQFARYGQIVIQ